MRWARSRRCCPRRPSRCCARWAIWWREEASSLTAEGDGVAAAVVAGCLYNLAVVVQKSQAELVAESGVALQVLGLVCHGFALTEAPVTVVQPIIASGIAFLVLFAALILRERPSAREIFGMLLAVSGVSLLALRIQGPVSLAPLDAEDFAYAIASAAALAGALWWFGRSWRVAS